MLLRIQSRERMKVVRPYEGVPSETVRYPFTRSLEENEKEIREGLPDPQL